MAEERWISVLVSPLPGWPQFTASRTAPARPGSTGDAHKFTASDFQVVCAPCRQLNPGMEGSAWQWEGFLLTEQISSKSPCRRG